MALPNLTGQYIQDTYQRVLQISSSGDIVDGTGSLFTPPNAISASYAVSSSHEIIKEVSSSHADTASFAQSGDGIFSGSFSGSYVGDGSNLTGVSAFPFVGDASITGSLTVSGSFVPHGKAGTNNVIIGEGAGAIANAQTTYNVFIGRNAGGNDNDFGDQNVLVGNEAGYLGNQTGNTSIGYHAGRGWGTTGATPTTGYNTSIGYQSGYGAATRTTAIHNTLLGAFSGRNINPYGGGNGNGNVLIGYYAGYENVGDGNIIIGSGSIGEDYMTNQLRIGNGNFHIISASLETGHVKFNSFDVNGSSRTLFTSCSLAYSGSNVTQVTQSYEAGTQQITNITYSGSFADGNPLEVSVTGSDGVSKLYTMTYSASLVTQILVS
tara:strand:+ start:911 stop:2047 length:1137 start_codon:yes stop_codon:yes gene_type:complete